MLKTKWDFVREKKRHKSNMEPFINEHIKSLKKELECVENEKAELRAEHKTLQQAMESNKKRWILKMRIFRPLHQTAIKTGII